MTNNHFQTRTVSHIEVAQEDSHSLAKKIFVGNLPYEAEENQLAAWFLANGFPTNTVSITIDRLSGQPRGFGFVEMNDKLAERCILACNGQDFLGRTLIINEASYLSGAGPPCVWTRLFPGDRKARRCPIDNPASCIHQVASSSCRELSVGRFDRGKSGKISVSDSSEQRLDTLKRKFVSVLRGVRRETGVASESSRRKRRLASRR